MPGQPKRQSTLTKYRTIQNRYRELYEVKRLRHDDVIQHLCKEFFIAHPNTVYRILATDCSVHADEDDDEV